MTNNSSPNRTAPVSNITMYQPSMPPQKVAEITFHTFVFVGGLIGNLFVAWVILRRKKMRTATNWLVFNLAVSDLVIVIYTLPLTNLLFFVPWPFGELGCKYLIMPTTEFPAGVCVLTHTALALVRYYIVCRPMSSGLQVRHISVMVFLIWGIAFTTMSVTLMGPLGYGEYNHEFKACSLKWQQPSYGKAYRVLVFSMTYIIPMIATGFAYVRIHTVLHKNMEVLQGHMSAEVIVNRQRQSRKVDRTLMTMYIFFALTTLPIQIFFICTDFKLIQISAVSRTIFMLFLALFYVQVISNPLVLFYMGDEYRKELYRLPVCCCIPNPQLRRLSFAIRGSFRGAGQKYRPRESTGTISLSRMSTRISRKSSKASRKSDKFVLDGPETQLLSNGRAKHSFSTMHSSQNGTPELTSGNLPKNCYIPLSFFTAAADPPNPDSNTPPGHIGTENGNFDDGPESTARDGFNSVDRFIAVNSETIGDIDLGVGESLDQALLPQNDSFHKTETVLHETDFGQRLKHSDSSDSTNSSNGNESSDVGVENLLPLPTGGIFQSYASSQTYDETEDSDSSWMETNRRNEIIHASKFPQYSSTPKQKYSALQNGYAHRTSDDFSPVLDRPIQIFDGELFIDGITRETLI